jgi:hypothetical protein
MKAEMSLKISSRNSKTYIKKKGVGKFETKVNISKEECIKVRFSLQ